MESEGARLPFLSSASFQLCLAPRCGELPLGVHQLQQRLHDRVQMARHLVQRARRELQEAFDALDTCMVSFTPD